ncbi:MAG: hypothetical protein FJZ97_03155 [Chloroflexi bacterium]|nr:hypothetical protein [Chloroflexota bacterium]
MSMSRTVWAAGASLPLMRLRLPTLVMGLLGVMITACDGGPASPTTTSLPTLAPPATSTRIAAEPTGAPIAAIVRAQASAQVRSVLVSPDGQLRAQVLTYGCTPVEGEGEYALDELVVETIASGERWLAAEQLQACGGLGAFGLETLFWSPGSRLLYYSTAREGVPDGCGFWLKPFSVADTLSRQAEELGGGVLSPDGRSLALVQAPDLVVWQLDEGETARIPLAALELPPGPIVWAPDGASLAYLQFGGNCQPEPPSYLVHVSLGSRESRTLLTSSDPVLGGLEWKDAGIITLWDEAGQRWEYDLAQSRLLQKP